MINGFDEIKQSVKDAASELGALLQSASDALEKAKRSVDHGNVVSKPNTPHYTASGDYKNAKYKQPQLYKNVKSESNGANVEAVAGGSLLLTGALTTGITIMQSFGGGMNILQLLLGGVMTVLGLVLGIDGLKRRSLVKRFKEYLRILKNKTYVTVDDVVRETGKSENKVEQELSELISKNYFMQGHLDKERDYFITSDETFRNYQEVLVRQEELKKIEAEQDAVLRESGLSTEGIRLFKKGQEFLGTINRLNSEIPDPVMTEKLQKLESQIRRILNEVRKKPESAGELRKLMNYYLPTTEKLVRSYQELQKREETAETKKTKEEIVLTLDTMNSAIEKMLNKLFLNENWDVSADISVLNQILSMEGLKEGQNSLKSGSSTR